MSTSIVRPRTPTPGLLVPPESNPGLSPFFDGCQGMCDQVLMVVLAGVCAVLTSGQTTLPNSLATLIPTGSATATATSSIKPTTDSSGNGVTSPSPTGFSTVTTTATGADGLPTQTTSIVPEGAFATSSESGPSTGALIGGTPP